MKIAIFMKIVIYSSDFAPGSLADLTFLSIELLSQ